MRDSAMSEITLRKYEPPSGDLERDLRQFLLSLGLVRPGSQDSPVETIFRELLLSKKPISVGELAKKAKITESAVRYHLERLKTLRLVEGRGEYSLAEGDISIAFKVFRRYFVEEILDRIEAYVESLESLVR
ncbi:MAG: winged helix-turn-helix transcriptional regulator [Candidatus Altiarchaeota archaeon]|nr:winged helix-turn-helix transcriptional regulator [Candidatus Altiarchaeota archaeon]